MTLLSQRAFESCIALDVPYNDFMLLMFTGLFLILVFVLLGPFLIKKVEEQLEAFFFVMGLLAVTISGMWSLHVVEDALLEPVKITLAVFLFGLVFHYLRTPIRHNILRVERVLGFRVFFFLIVVGLGLLSSVITAIIASLLLVEIISGIRLDKRAETELVIISCFSIGLGAALTPIGEPLSTIAVFKLKGEPYHADFWFLLKILWPFIIPGILALGIFADFLHARHVSPDRSLHGTSKEALSGVFLRAGRVYLFVMALVLLGTGFMPIVDAFVVRVPGWGLYWLNMISAVLDNATLTAAEVSPKMSLDQISLLLMGLLIAGGMLVPGNIPNIIAAGRLKIPSRDWARLGVPLGLVLMAIYFPILLLTT